MKPINQYHNLAQAFEDACQQFSNNIFLVEDDCQYSFGEIHGQVNQTCVYLKELGVTQGDTISLVLKNSREYVLLFLASMKLGATINPFPFHLSSEEIEKNIKIISPKFVFSHDPHFQKIKNSIQGAHQIGNEFFETLSAHPSSQIKAVTDNTHQIAVLYYSSGTTGDPKILRYSNHSQVETMESLIREGFIKENDSHICLLPLGHTAAIRYTFLPCLCTGSKMIIYESFWKIRSKIFNIIDEHKVTFFEIVPSILSAILNTPYKDFVKSQTKSLRFIGCGSSYLPIAQQKEFMEKYGVPVANLYGLSETGPTHFDNPLVPNWQPGSIGKPIDIVECIVIDDQGNEVSDGEIGEAAVKGPSVFSGYLGNEQLMTESLTESGHFKTGDFVKKDSSGNYFYVDRKKDLIIKGGVNLVPSQIDNFLQTNQSIKEAATIGIPDKFLGEEIKSYIVLRDDRTLNKEELIEQCKETLGKFKTPKYIEVVEELPKGPSGKILKRELRKREREQYEKQQAGS